MKCFDTSSCCHYVGGVVGAIGTTTSASDCWRSAQSTAFEGVQNLCAIWTKLNIIYWRNVLYCLDQLPIGGIPNVG